MTTEYVVYTYSWKSVTLGHRCCAEIHQTGDDKYFVSLYINGMPISHVWYGSLPAALRAGAILENHI